jgi:hypothetical protein
MKHSLREEAMPTQQEIHANPEISLDYKTFEEFCSENSGTEMAYLEVVAKNPLEMDAVTIAFSMRHLLRLSTGVIDQLLVSLPHDEAPELSAILATKGIHLDKTHAGSLRDVIFAFRNCEDVERQVPFVKALQLMTISRERRRVVLNLGESYNPPDEGWTEEDFGGDDSLLQTVRSIEDPRWNRDEEEEY